ncbi:histidinol-phosphatase HisJ family protein [uncultured Acetatifactor sp.]|uniref:histidinol-phosphatase HisJ family protein n=1 Tax=uncultured Acetatifactor sp. TaxID=1671927 RepID=UPI00260547E7|nr:histidinol-phosphatase HisJ family protein [uncultured Acetatifactor sp.]
MPITADCHLHSSFSGDSDTPMEEMILQGIARGLTTMCFTEHNDFDYPEYPDLPKDFFLLNTDSYLYDLARLREQYAGQIRLLFGVELGLQPEIMRKNAVYAKSYDFDFVIGSTHICRGKDPYYPGLFEGRDAREAIREYFEDTLENIRKFSNFDVYGHLDYVVRYAPEQDRGYSYELYRDILDEILKLLLDKGKGIELNTGGLKNGMRDFHPCMGALKRYRELGGEVITIGSDSHDADNIAAHFQRAAHVLKECGFRYYCVFEKRSPEFHKL